MINLCKCSTDILKLDFPQADEKLLIDKLLRRYLKLSALIEPFRRYSPRALEANILLYEAYSDILNYIFKQITASINVGPNNINIWTLYKDDSLRSHDLVVCMEYKRAIKYMRKILGSRWTSIRTASLSFYSKVQDFEDLQMLDCRRTRRSNFTDLELISQSESKISALPETTLISSSSISVPTLESSIFEDENNSTLSSNEEYRSAVLSSGDGFASQQANPGVQSSPSRSIGDVATPSSPSISSQTLSWPTTRISSCQSGTNNYRNNSGTNGNPIHLILDISLSVRKFS